MYLHQWFRFLDHRSMAISRVHTPQSGVGRRFQGTHDQKRRPLFARKNLTLREPFTLRNSIKIRNGSSCCGSDHRYLICLSGHPTFDVHRILYLHEISPLKLRLAHFRPVRDVFEIDIPDNMVNASQKLPCRGFILGIQSSCKDMLSMYVCNKNPRFRFWSNTAPKPERTHYIQSRIALTALDETRPLGWKRLESRRTLSLMENCRHTISFGCRLMVATLTRCKLATLPELIAPRISTRFYCTFGETWQT